MNSYAIETIGVIRSEPDAVRGVSDAGGVAPRESVIIEVETAHAGKLRDVRKGDEILVVTMRPGRTDGAAALALHRTRVAALGRETVRVAPLGELDGTAVVGIEAVRDRAPVRSSDPWKFSAPAWPSRYS